MVEAGVSLSVDEWLSWSAESKQVWINAKNKQFRLETAMLAKVLANSINGNGVLAEHLVMPDMPEDMQEAMLAKQELRKAKENARNTSDSGG